MTFLSRIMLLKSQAHFSADVHRAGATMNGTFKGTGKRKTEMARKRVGLMIAGFAVAYAIIGGRLVQYGYAHPETVSSILPADRLMASRPDIVDRNGEVLATDIRTVSLFAEPNKIVDADEAVEKLATVLTDLDIKGTYKKLSNPQSHFQWLRRQLTPKQQSQILALGIPGIGFRPEKRRFYPGGTTASHIVGYVNIDNRGMSGMEKYIDNQGMADLRALGMTSDTPLEPVKLSIDLRVQNILHDVVSEAITKFEALGAGGVVLDVHTGEVLAMVSMPDFDPNNPAASAQEGWLNRMSNGTFEMGSTFKSFTLAMGLDEGKVSLNSTVDARYPIRIGGFTIKDFHGKNRVLSVPEIFQYSSNIGTGEDCRHGGDGRSQGVSEEARSDDANEDGTARSRHAQPARVNGKRSIRSLFRSATVSRRRRCRRQSPAWLWSMAVNCCRRAFCRVRRREADQVAEQVIQPSTSKDMRFLFEWNGVKGSGRNARVDGFNVGGKTGTADKVVNGRYVGDKNLQRLPFRLPDRQSPLCRSDRHRRAQDGPRATVQRSPVRRLRPWLRKSSAEAPQFSV